MSSSSKANLIVSGADALFGDLMVDCVASLRAVGYAGPIAILDFGLTDTQCALLQSHDATIHKIPVPEIYQKLIDSGFLKGPAGANVLLMKPYLPEIFPGYETYLFIDADCWFQTAEAIEALCDTAQHTSFAAISQRSRFHDMDSARGNGIEFNVLGQPLRRNWYTMFANKSKLPKADKKLMAQSTIINAGVFAANHDSPIWKCWQKEMYSCVLALPPRRKYGADQLGLGLAIYRHNIAHLLLPETCNWHTVFRYDRQAQQFTETMPYYKAVSIMHLAGIHPHETKCEVLFEDGTSGMIDLRYQQQ